MLALKRAACLLLVLGVSACGWQLRGLNQQNQLTELYVIASDRYSPLTLALLEILQQQGAEVDPQASMQLLLGEERLRKRTVAVTSIGSPAQYELTLTAEYQYRLASEDQAVTLPRTLTVTRAFDYDPNNTVAKNQEENALLEEMRRELARRILQLAPAAVDNGQTQL